MHGLYYQGIFSVILSRKPRATKKQLQAVTLTLKTDKSTLTHILQQAMKGSTVTIVSAVDRANRK
jgi:hypothetical protein